MRNSFPDDDRIRVAVVTGHHFYDVPGFHRLSQSLPEVDAYIQPMEDWSFDAAKVRDLYDVVLFYNMHTKTPTEQDPSPFQKMKEALESLGGSEQGILVLHHAVLAFMKWPLWSELVGIQDRSFGFFPGQTLRVEIANPDHPITEGLESWEILDETYTMDAAGEGSEILLTTDHPKSARTIAWTRQYKKSRVFCLQLGHDNLAWVSPGFRTALARGIQWCAARI